MSAFRWIVLSSIGLAVGGCYSSLPVPDYVSVKTPAPYRTASNGSRVDNEDYVLDAQGYRLDKNGQRFREVDIPAKTAGQGSNAVAGFYISSTGAKAPGRIATPGEGATAGAGFGPGSAGMAPAAMPAPTTAPAAPASGAPVPLRR